MQTLKALSRCMQARVLLPRPVLSNWLGSVQTYSKQPKHLGAVHQQVNPNAPARAALRESRVTAAPRDQQLDEEDEDYDMGGEDVDFNDLPVPVQRRLVALRDVQANYDELVTKYHQEKALLDAKFLQQYTPLFDDRAAIIAGTKEVEKGDTPDTDEQDSGLPDFWLTALTNHELIGDQITDRDAEVLKYLTDIRYDVLTGPDYGFKLMFHFADNPHLTDKVLEKTYVMEDMEQLIPKRFTGCTISWAPGKDTTVITRTKKVQDRKLRGKAPAVAVTQSEPCESFFTFFNPPQLPEDPADITDEELEQLQEDVDKDFEIGCAIKDQVVPRALEWYTGEAAAGFDFDDYGEYDEEFEEFEEEEAPRPPAGKQKGRKN